MKRYTFFSAVISLVLFIAVSPVLPDPFKNLWYDGNAEISIYNLTESRYGEKRKGKRIMVFVTEPMRLSTHIKPDVRLPDTQKIDVIKLNDIRKFNTGIYDYSVMTSVFSSVDDSKNLPLLSTMKVAFTSQEWCGNVFEVLKRKGDQYEGKLFSYFESDGEPTYKILIKQRTEPEDNLWLMVRELKGPLLDAGEKIELSIIPSTWNRRKAHQPFKTVKAILAKERSGKIRTRAGKFETHLFSWTYPGQKVRVWVERKYPHRIIKWEEADGTRGILAATSREPYWKQNQNKYQRIRNRLTLYD